MCCFNTHRFIRLVANILLLLLICHSIAAQAQIEQFNVFQCAQLEAALKLNREQQRRGYQLKQELKIKAQQTQLELQIDYHCQHPQTLDKPEPKRSKARSADRRFTTGQAKPSGSLERSPKKIPTTQALAISVIHVKAPYQGAKQAAWLSFYQTPFYCFGVRQTERIRQCVEQRQQAQLRFERHYDMQGQAVRQ